MTTLLALVIGCAGTVPDLAAAVPRAQSLFSKYHWEVDRTSESGAASAFALSRDGRLRLRISLAEGAGRASYLDLHVNGEFVTRIDHRGAIGLRAGQGINPEGTTPWIEVKGAPARAGLNKLTLVYRGQMGRGDHLPPGPGRWKGQVNLSRCRLFDVLVLTQGFAQLTGWEAEMFRTLQVLDGDLRAGDTHVALHRLNDRLEASRRRSKEILNDPEVRRFFAELDDLHYSRTATRLDLFSTWRARLTVVDRLQRLLQRSRLHAPMSVLYRSVPGIHDSLLDAALARENLRNLHAAFAARPVTAFTLQHLKSVLNIGRQNLESLQNLDEAIDRTRGHLRNAALVQAERGRPRGSSGIQSPYSVLAAHGSRFKPTEYADGSRITAVEGETNLYLTVLGEYIEHDRGLTRLFLTLMANLIGNSPPVPSTKRRVVPRLK